MNSNHVMLEFVIESGVVVGGALLALASRLDIQEFWYLGKAHCRHLLTSLDCLGSISDAWQLEHVDGCLVLKFGDLKHGLCDIVVGSCLHFFIGCIVLLSVCVVPFIFLGLIKQSF